METNGTIIAGSPVKLFRSVAPPTWYILLICNQLTVWDPLKGRYYFKIEESFDDYKH